MIFVKPARVQSAHIQLCPTVVYSCLKFIGFVVKSIYQIVAAVEGTFNIHVYTLF